MYRCFLLFAVLNIADSAFDVCRWGGSYCRPLAARYYGPPHNYYKGDGIPTTAPNNVIPPPPNTFEDLAQSLITAEAAIQQHCRDNANGDVKEVFGIDSYILKYPLPGFEVQDVAVKIKHKVIYVTAERPGVAFKDMRILPKIVNTREASFAIESGQLKIFIPYNMVFRKESVLSCGEVSGDVIDVPSAQTNPMVLRTPLSKETFTTNDDDLQQVLNNIWPSSDIDIRNSKVVLTK